MQIQTMSPQVQYLGLQASFALEVNTNQHRLQGFSESVTPTNLAVADGSNLMQKFGLFGVYARC